MMTSSNGNIFRVTGLLCGEFTGPGEFPTQRPVTRSFDVLFDLRLNKRLSKEPWGWWFETPSWSLWRQRNDSPPFLNPGVAHVVNTPRPGKTAAIFKTTFSNAFSWMKMYEFRLRFHWSLFLRVQLNKQYPSIGSDSGLAPIRRQTIV